MSYVRSENGTLSYWIGVPLLLIAALAESSVLPQFRAFGLQPNLVLVILTAWVMVRGQDEALYLIPLGGLFLGLTEGAQLGAALIALAPLVILHELRGSSLSEGQFAVALLFMLAATLVYQAVYLLVFVLEGQAGHPGLAAFRVVLLTCVLNLIILPPAYFLIWAASGDRRRAAFA